MDKIAYLAKDSAAMHVLEKGKREAKEVPRFPVPKLGSSEVDERYLDAGGRLDLDLVLPRGKDVTQRVVAAYVRGRNRAGTTATANGDFRTATNELRRAHAFATAVRLWRMDEGERQHLLALTLSNMAVLQRQNGHPDRALELLEEAARLELRLEYACPALATGVGDCFVNLGSVRSEVGDHRGALDALKRAVPRLRSDLRRAQDKGVERSLKEKVPFDETKDPAIRSKTLSLATALFNLGVEHEHLKKWDSAVIAYHGAARAFASVLGVGCEQATAARRAAYEAETRVVANQVLDDAAKLPKDLKKAAKVQRERDRVKRFETGAPPWARGPYLSIGRASRKRAGASATIGERTRSLVDTALLKRATAAATSSPPHIPSPSLPITSIPTSKSSPKVPSAPQLRATLAAETAPLEPKPRYDLRLDMKRTGEQLASLEETSRRLTSKLLETTGSSSRGWLWNTPTPTPLPLSSPFDTSLKSLDTTWEDGEVESRGGGDGELEGMEGGRKSDDPMGGMPESVRRAIFNIDETTVEREERRRVERERRRRRGGGERGEDAMRLKRTAFRDAPSVLAARGETDNPEAMFDLHGRRILPSPSSSPVVSKRPVTGDRSSLGSRASRIREAASRASPTGSDAAPPKVLSAEEEEDADGYLSGGRPGHLRQIRAEVLSYGSNVLEDASKGERSLEEAAIFLAKEEILHSGGGITEDAQAATLEHIMSVTGEIHRERFQKMLETRMGRKG